MDNSVRRSAAPPHCAACAGLAWQITLMYCDRKIKVSTAGLINGLRCHGVASLGQGLCRAWLNQPIGQLISSTGHPLSQVRQSITHTPVPSEGTAARWSMVSSLTYGCSSGMAGSLPLQPSGRMAQAPPGQGWASWCRLPGWQRQRFRRFLTEWRNHPSVGASTAPNSH